VVALIKITEVCMLITAGEKT